MFYFNLNFFEFLNNFLSNDMFSLLWRLVVKRRIVELEEIYFLWNTFLYFALFMHVHCHNISENNVYTFLLPVTFTNITFFFMHLPLERRKMELRPHEAFCSCLAFILQKGKRNRATLFTTTTFVLVIV